MKFSTTTCALLGIFVLLNSGFSECLQMSVLPEAGTNVTLSTSRSAEECSVCRVSGVNGSELACFSTLSLQPEQSVTLQYNCTNPHEAFTAEILKTVECTEASCSPATGQTQPSLFKDLSRTFIWQLTGPEETQLVLTFPEDGLKKIEPSETCPDQYQYTVVSTQPNGDVHTEKFCRTGPVSHVDLPNKAVVNLQVPGKEEVDQTLFEITSKPLVKRSRMINVAPEPQTTIFIRKVDPESACTVCKNEGSEPSQCSNSLTLTGTNSFSVDFTCPQPQDSFRVEINKEIDCSETDCPGDVVQAEFPHFLEFNRSFTWDLRVSPLQAFKLDFSGPGMKQVLPSDSCPDEHTYSIITYQRTGPLNIGTYCRNGSISMVQVLYKGRLSLMVPAERKLDPEIFKVSTGGEIKKLAVVNVNLPSKTSVTELFSANYPDNFPDDDLMMWDFRVPPNYNYTVKFLENTAPRCLRKEVAVEYQQDGKYKIGRKLTDTQPTQQQGSFTMSLTNCETDRRGNPPGLSLKFQVAVVKSSHPVLCTVDLENEPDLTIEIEKTTSGTFCEMKMDAVVQDKIIVPPGKKTNLAFQDCPSKELKMTASKTLGCQKWEECPMEGTQLTLPVMAQCLPVQMQKMTWNLMVPGDGTVDLLPTTGNLRQSLPGQECERPYIVNVAEVDGTPFGEFCPKGAISKVQIHSNISVTATPRPASRSQASPFFNVTFSREINESYIFTVSPKVASPSVVSTPNWPDASPSGEGHTYIKVQTLGSLEEMLSRREDEKMEDTLNIPDSFYLNTSNCLLEEGEFSLLSKITLQKKSNVLLPIILGTIGALLFLMLIVLAVVCVVLRKKKKKLAKEASIYIPKGNIFLPGEGGFPKSRASNESHVYTSIEDNMVYGHLLHDPAYSGPVTDQYGGPQADGKPSRMEKAPMSDTEQDVYRPFLDPSQGMGPARPHTPVDRQGSLGFVDRRMVDNELNTFKSNGDLTPLRLSTVEPQAEPIGEMEEAL
ncbi:hypothetical protein AGOR_G00038830 [Albula goreensis]|uniref:CUB domain-containing protein 1 n=1 Tax=Albula goreensis TaxID=1534307 RepID=A0A8T3E5F7_9TELE|nr:hypothetical protein AGOR_G00038830 [Albula goreensis]